MGGKPRNKYINYDDGASALREAMGPYTQHFVGWCACCESPAEGNYSIHRDGFGEGPEVWLCDACGSKPTPTCEEIWARIAENEAMWAEFERMLKEGGLRK